MSNGVAQSVITSEVEIKGSIKSTGSVRMDGKLDGDLASQGDAILGKTATMKGNISGQQRGHRRDDQRVDHGQG